MCWMFQQDLNYLGGFRFIALKSFDDCVGWFLRKKCRMECQVHLSWHSSRLHFYASSSKDSYVSMSLVGIGFLLRDANFIQGGERLDFSIECNCLLYPLYVEEYTKEPFKEYKLRNFYADHFAFYFWHSAFRQALKLVWKNLRVKDTYARVKRFHLRVSRKGAPWTRWVVLCSKIRKICLSRSWNVVAAEERTGKSVAFSVFFQVVCYTSFTFIKLRNSTPVCFFFI